jgi:hypothetical protein
VIELGRPAVALAGALLALLPIVLHLVTRRPPASAPLPTARFLEPERLIRVHLERRPTDLLQLILRVLLVSTLSIAFAEPSWSAEGSDVADVVLLDGSAAMEPFWAEALDSVSAILDRSRSGAEAESADAGANVTLIVFDSIARDFPVSRAWLDSLRSSFVFSDRPSADLALGLSALRWQGASLSADSVRAWIIFSAQRGSWRPGLGGLRRSAWPGEIGVIAFPPPAATVPSDVVMAPADDLPVQSSLSSTYVFDETESDRVVLQAALEALGLSPGALGSAPSGETAWLAFTAAPADQTLKQALDAGGTVVVGPATYASVPGVEPIWRPEENAPVSPALLRFDDGLIVRGGSVVSGRAAPGARWIAATAGGKPAAVAMRVGEGCLVTAAFDPVSLIPTAAASIPDVLARLLHGCAPPEPSPDAALPLDAGALSVLALGFEGGDAPADDRGSVDAPAANVASPSAPVRSAPPRAVAMDLLRERSADPWLVRALLLLALTLACVEAYLSYGRRAPKPA